MNRRDEFDGEGRTENPITALSGPGARRPDTVIPFRRRDTAASPAASDIPPMSEAPFMPLGNAVQAVVLRLKDRSTREEEEEDWDLF